MTNFCNTGCSLESRSVVQNSRKLFDLFSTEKKKVWRAEKKITQASPNWIELPSTPCRALWVRDLLLHERIEVCDCSGSLRKVTCDERDLLTRQHFDFSSFALVLLHIEQIYAPVPLPTRAQPIHIGGDPKGVHVLYCVGNSVVTRNTQVCAFLLPSCLFWRWILILVIFTRMQDISKAELYQQHAQNPTVARFAPSGFYIASAGPSLLPSPICIPSPGSPSSLLAFSLF